MNRGDDAAVGSGCAEACPGPPPPLLAALCDRTCSARPPNLPPDTCPTTRCPLCSILHTLRVRYALDSIYTYSGNILIAVGSGVGWVVQRVGWVCGAVLLNHTITHSGKVLVAVGAASFQTTDSIRVLLPAAGGCSCVGFPLLAAL